MNVEFYTNLICYSPKFQVNFCQKSYDFKVKQTYKQCKKENVRWLHFVFNGNMWSWYKDSQLGPTPILPWKQWLSCQMRIFGKVKDSGVIDTDSGHDLIPRLQKNSSRRAPLLRWMRIKTERFVRISSLFPKHFFFIPFAFLFNFRCISS